MRFCFIFAKKRDAITIFVVGTGVNIARQTHAHCHGAFLKLPCLPWSPQFRLFSLSVSEEKH